MKKKLQPFREGMDAFTWVSRDGKPQPVSKMPDGYILNVLSVIEQSVDGLAKGRKSRKAIMAKLREVVPCYEALVHEVEVRNLEGKR
jgi:hypothetical protein